MLTHAELLKRLLPPGAYDPAAPLLSAALDAEGAALDAAQAVAELILAEFDPRLTIHLLPEWERTLGLPDPCTGTEPTDNQRRAAIATRATGHPNLSRAYFIALAAALGYPITITEFDLHTVMSDVNASLYDWSWGFVWQVNAPLINTVDFTVLSAVNEPLSVSSNDILECVIRQHKPAHTFVQFSYS